MCCNPKIMTTIIVTHRLDRQIPGELLAILANTDGQSWLGGPLGQRRGDLQIPESKSIQRVQYSRFEVLMIGRGGPRQKVVNQCRGNEKQTLYSIRGRVVMVLMVLAKTETRGSERDLDTPRN